jgi:hypothetical protein
MNQSNEALLLQLLHNTIKEWVNNGKILNSLQEKTDDLNHDLDSISSGLWEPYVKITSTSQLAKLTEEILSPKIMALEMQQKESLRKFLNLHETLDRRLQDYLHINNLLGQAARNTEPGISGSPLCFIIEMGMDLFDCLDKQIHFNESSKHKDWLKFLDNVLVSSIQDCHNRLERSILGKLSA